MRVTPSTRCTGFLLLEKRVVRGPGGFACTSGLCDGGAGDIWERGAGDGVFEPRDEGAPASGPPPSVLTAGGGGPDGMADEAPRGDAWLAPPTATARTGAVVRLRVETIGRDTGYEVDSAARPPAPRPPSGTGEVAERSPPLAAPCAALPRTLLRRLAFSAAAALSSRAELRASARARASASISAIDLRSSSPLAPTEMADARPGGMAGSKPAERSCDGRLATDLRRPESAAIAADGWLGVELTSAAKAMEEST